MSVYPWEPRLANLEGAFDQLDKRLGDFIRQVDARFAQVDARFAQVDARFIRVDERFDVIERKIETQFRWVVGLIVLSILLPLVTRFLPH